MLAVAVFVAPNPSFAQSETNDDPVVHGVFFFSPTCPHCELVLQEHLPEVFWQFGGDPALRYDDTARPGYLVLLIGWISSRRFTDARAIGGRDGIRCCIWRDIVLDLADLPRAVCHRGNVHVVPRIGPLYRGIALADGSSGMGSGRSPSGVAQCRRVGPPRQLQDQVFDLSGYT
jgi:hypothetical protein